DYIRRYQIAEILRHTAPHLHSIIMGDFNTEDITPFLRAGYTSIGAEYLTCSEQRIDYILARNVPYRDLPFGFPNNVCGLERETDIKQTGSDHVPVFAQLGE